MTKYARQIASAHAKIVRAGTVCTWYKPGEDNGNDPTPEFPELADAASFENVPIVLIPLSRLTEATSLYNAKLAAPDTVLFGYIPGDVSFTPVDGDAILVEGTLYHCNYVNTTQPDGTPIIHEIGMK